MPENIILHWYYNLVSIHNLNNNVHLPDMKIKRYGSNVTETALKPRERQREFKNLEFPTEPSTRVE